MSAPGDPPSLFAYQSDPQPTTTLGLETTEPELDATPPRRSLVWNGGADLGLLVLRVVLGGAFLAHGLRIVFGLFGGAGVNAFARGLADYGYHQTTTLAWLAGIGEIVGGGAVVLGVFTPFAAAGLLGIAINSLLVKYGNGFFVQPDNPAGTELDVLLVGMATALMFTGPGRVALDNGRVWFRRPLASGWISLVLGVAAGLLIYFLLRRA